MSTAVAFTEKVVKRMTSGVGTLMKGNHIEAVLAAEGRPIHIPPKQVVRAK